MTFASFVDSLQELFGTAGKLKSSETQLVMRERYLLDFGITDRAQLENRPLGLVAMFDAEDPLSGNLREERMIEFAELDLHNLFGISIDDYLDLPRYEIDMLNSAAKHVKKKRNTNQSDEVAKLEKMLREAGIAIPPK